MDTILMLTGITKLEDLSRFAFKPTHVLRDLDQIRAVTSAFD